LGDCDGAYNEIGCAIKFNDNNSASYGSGEPTSSGFVVRTAETGVGGAARTGLKNPTK
jgi:hypothetical protein